MKEAIKVVVIKDDDKFNNLINRVMEMNGIENKNRLLLFHEILTLHVNTKGKLFFFFFFHQ